ncbi:hypothetical protein MCOR27_011458 [Pyricularia oryzae]|uniref:Pre-mRNA-processing factor 19 n=4 Tax=Pyricularia TaxID=48558 RepID=A0ABQ8N3S5_PYRGI|nr:spliceosome component [Pyricularia oryzae 70-15]ELQ42218.1 spliceosome component [Pyricularia oryzae Y34]KAH8843695.1 hypothetical protein MCOR01_004485 [Pyricularia oryzae]KAI6289943.1 hypothetical protein MCOR33_011626 [Pyricularia grisea]EHA50568.1 spliceosome component [Pyricularia oryzae 70-15]KAI6251762.1 hypothetical protein MCOR19_011607 [Pyricularia oryzae]
MLCSISGEAPQEPVVSTKSGNVYEKRLIEKYIDEHGKEPGSDTDLDKEDLLPIQTSRVVRPRPAALTSIPALLSTFQNEWDSLALETYNLQQQLQRTREELANALYQHDAAIRVIARLTKERNEARDALAKVTVSAPAPAAANAGDSAMAIDSELPQDVAEHVDETAQMLSKSRKKRPTPPTWASPEDISSLEKVASDSLHPLTQATSLGVDGGYAAVGGFSGDLAIYSLEAAKLERTLNVGEPVTAVLWSGTKVILGTTKGAVKVYDSGSEVASFSEHAGGVTGLAIHPGSDIVASVGADRGVVLYQLSTLKKVFQTRTDASLTMCAFHPDGALVAAGTTSGDIKLFHTKTLEEAASFPLGAPVQAVAFSENGYWFAAVAKAQTAVTIMDLRKSGDAAKVKTLDVGTGVLAALAWDYTGRFLAAAGASGVSVQGYNKSSKAWTSLLQKGDAAGAVALAWGPDAKKLVAIKPDGVLEMLGVPSAAEEEAPAAEA